MSDNDDEKEEEGMSRSDTRRNVLCSRLISIDDERSDGNVSSDDVPDNSEIDRVRSEPTLVMILLVILGSKFVTFTISSVKVPVPNDVATF